MAKSRKATSLRKQRSRQRRAKILAAALGGLAVGGLTGAIFQQSKMDKLLLPLEEAKSVLEEQFNSLQRNYDLLRKSYEAAQIQQQQLVAQVAIEAKKLEDEVQRLRAAQQVLH